LPLQKTRKYYSTGIYHCCLSDKSYYTKCKAARCHVRSRIDKFEHYYHINNITNCPTGQFHNWVSLPGTKNLCVVGCGTSIDVAYDEKNSLKKFKVFLNMSPTRTSTKNIVMMATLRNYIYILMKNM